MLEKNPGKEFIQILPSKFHIVIHVLQRMYVNRINNNETWKIPRNVFLFFFLNFVLALAKWIDFLNEVYRLWFIKNFFQKFSHFKVF